MPADQPLVAVISAVGTAATPAEQALADRLPDARVWNILDDRLLSSVQEAGEVTPALAARMQRLIDHALAEGADGVLVTCSVYGDVVRERAERERIPVLASDDAGFDAVIAGGFASVLLVSPISEALTDSRSRLERAAAAAGRPLHIDGAVAEGTHRAAARGADELGALVVATIGAVDAPYDAILLGQYSLALAAPAVVAAYGVPVFTTPGAAADRLADSLGPSRGAAG